MNGSPLFTGDAGSGESEIRRFIVEHDLLEALIALPEQLFYDTDIATYIWVATNRKASARRGKVQLIDATAFWTPMRKGLCNKRREIPLDPAQDIVKIVADFEDGDTRTIDRDGKKDEVIVSKICPTTHFGFRKITVERPQRLNFQATPERIQRLEDERGVLALAQSKKKGAAGAKEQAVGREQQEAIRALLQKLPATLYKDRSKFAAALEAAARQAGIKRGAPVTRAILSALSERDETAAIRRDADGDPEPDPELRDTESVPLAESVEAFFEREVKTHVPDAWIGTASQGSFKGSRPASVAGPRSGVGRCPGNGRWPLNPPGKEPRGSKSVTTSTRRAHPDQRPSRPRDESALRAVGKVEHGLGWWPRR